MRSRLVMKSSAEEKIKERKKHLLPEQKDLGTQYLGEFEWKPGDILTLYFPVKSKS